MLSSQLKNTMQRYLEVVQAFFTVFLEARSTNVCSISIIFNLKIYNSPQKSANQQE